MAATVGGKQEKLLSAPEADLAESGKLVQGHIWLLSYHLRARIVCTFLKGWKKNTEYATETVCGS